MKHLRFLVAVLWLLSAASTAAASDGLGPLSVRHQGIAHLPHLWMMPRNGRISEYCCGAFLGISWANHWGWDNDREPRYFVDAETAVLDVVGSFTIAKKCEVGLGVPVMWHGGGILDFPITAFHQSFGLDQSHRTMLPAQREKVWIGSREDHVILLSESDPSPIPLNPWLSTSFGLLDLGPDKPSLCLTLAGSIPLGGSTYWRPTWAEPGIGTAFSWPLGRLTMHVNGSFVWIGDRRWAGAGLRQWVVYSLAGIEVRAGRLTFIAQGHFDTPIMEQQGDMGNPGYCVTAGLRYSPLKWLAIELGGSENIFFFDATPDIVVYLGIRLLHPVRKPAG